MANIIMQSETMTEIADAIRAKTGKADSMLPSEMAEEINSIESGSSAERDAEWIKHTITSVVIPDDISIIPAYIFYHQTNLKYVYLPASVRNIGTNAFNGCSKLVLTELPAGVTSISGNAFVGCSNLQELTFKGKPNSISSTAFRDCNNLTVINVPWSEGEIANAPWGATNATINYNYTMEESDED